MTNTESSVVGTLAAHLRRDISLGVIRPGQKLNIEALKREHKVSHPSVREALALLVGEGYVASADQKGFRVLESSTEQLQDITRVRAELECLAFEWSVRNADTEWRGAVTGTHYALSEVEAEMAKDPIAFALEWDESNRRFHLALCSKCGSPNLIELIETQYDLTRRYRLMAHSNRTNAADRAEWIENSSREHSALKEAALNSDVGAGKKLLRTHITKAAQQFGAAIVALKA